MDRTGGPISTAGLEIRVIDPDDDYLGIEIHAWNTRFSGTTWIYAGLNDLGELASQVTGFPAQAGDQRGYEFGSPDPRVAGGWCRLRFVTLDAPAHAAVEVEIEDEARGNILNPGTARLTIPVEAAEVDRFVQALRRIGREQTGEATLHAP